jgi:hypothetical protein
MQVIWMVLITLGLALGGVLGLALVTHLDDRLQGVGALMAASGPRCRC